MAPEGTTAQRWYMRGVFIGMDLERDDQYKSIMNNLDKMMETTRIIVHQLQQEQKAHQAQILEFVQQINLASDIVSKFQSSTEQLRLEALNRQI